MKKSRSLRRKCWNCDRKEEGGSIIMQMDFSFSRPLCFNGRWNSWTITCMFTTHHCALEAHKWSIHECFLEIRYEFFVKTKRVVYNFDNPCIFVSSWGFAVDRYSLPLKISIISVCSHPRWMPSLLLLFDSKCLPKFLPFHSYAYWVIEYSSNGIAHHQFCKISFDFSSQVHKKLSHWETRFINFLWWNKYIARTMSLLINGTLH